MKNLVFRYGIFSSCPLQSFTTGRTPRATVSIALTSLLAASWKYYRSNSSHERFFGAPEQFGKGVLTRMFTWCFQRVAKVFSKQGEFNILDCREKIVWFPCAPTCSRVLIDRIDILQSSTAGRTPEATVRFFLTSRLAASRISPLVFPSVEPPL